MKRVVFFFAYAPNESTRKCKYFIVYYCAVPFSFYKNYK